MECKIWSRPGAEVFVERASALDTSPIVRGV